MGLQVNRLVQANIYVNGVNLLGEAEEITIGRIKAKSVEHKALGMVGEADFPASLDKMELSIKWTSLYLEPETFLGSPFRTNAFQIRGNLETYGSTGLISQQAAIWLVNGPTMEMGDLKLSKGENADATTKIQIWHLEQYIGARQTLLYDLFSNQFIVDGVDELAQFRANIGG